MGLYLGTWNASNSRASSIFNVPNCMCLWRLQNLAVVRISGRNWWFPQKHAILNCSSQKTISMGILQTLTH